MERLPLKNEEGYMITDPTPSVMPTKESRKENLEEEQFGVSIARTIPCEEYGLLLIRN